MKKLSLRKEQENVIINFFKNNKDKMLLLEHKTITRDICKFNRLYFEFDESKMDYGLPFYESSRGRINKLISESKSFISINDKRFLNKNYITEVNISYPKMSILLKGENREKSVWIDISKENVLAFLEKKNDDELGRTLSFLLFKGLNFIKEWLTHDIEIVLKRFYKDLTDEEKLFLEVL